MTLTGIYSEPQGGFTTAFFNSKYLVLVKERTFKISYSSNAKRYLLISLLRGLMLIWTLALKHIEADYKNKLVRLQKKKKKNQCNVLLKNKQIYFLEVAIIWNNFSLHRKALLFIVAYCQFGLFTRFHF